MQNLMLGLGKMAQLEKYLLHKHEDPNLDPGSHIKSRACDPSAREAETRDPRPVCPSCLLLRWN